MTRASPPRSPQSLLLGKGEKEADERRSLHVTPKAPPSAPAQADGGGHLRFLGRPFPLGIERQPKAGEARSPKGTLSLSLSPPQAPSKPLPIALGLDCAESGLLGTGLPTEPVSRSWVTQGKSLGGDFLLACSTSEPHCTP